MKNINKLLGIGMIVKVVPVNFDKQLKNKTTTSQNTIFFLKIKTRNRHTNLLKIILNRFC